MRGDLNVAALTPSICVGQKGTMQSNKGIIRSVIVHLYRALISGVFIGMQITAEVPKRCAARATP